MGRVAKKCDVVDDISQEVCLRIIEKEKLWNRNSSQLSAWMNSIARNLTLDYIRRKKEISTEERGKYFLHSKEESFSDEQIEWVVKQFQSLSERQSQILNMRYYQNMKVTEIAKLLHMAQPNVSREIVTALKELRKKARSQGFLAVLLVPQTLRWPWNWEWILSMQVAVMSKVKLGISLFCLALFCFLGYVVIEGDFGSAVENGQDLDIKAPTVITKINIVDNKDTHSKLLDKKKLISPVAKKIEMSKNDKISKIFSNADFEETLKWLVALNPERFAELTLEDLKTITELNLRDLKVNDSDLKHIKGLTSLTKLHLSDTQVTDVGLKELSLLTSLEELNLHRLSGITDVGLKELSRLKSLKKLGFLSKKITDVGVKELLSLPLLADLDLWRVKITDAGLKDLSQMKSLTRLTLSGFGREQITAKGLEELTALPSLTTLWLGQSDVSDEALEGLSHMKSLNELSVRFTNITGQGFEKLGSLTSLIKLNLEYTKLTDENIENIGFLTSLTELDLSNTGITDQGLEKLSFSNSLKYLCLRDTKVTDKGIKKLKMALPNCHIYK